MIIVLHPEELLDREASGVLTAAEREVLAAHAARCAACACERRLRVAFADVLREPLAPSPSSTTTTPPLPPRTSPAPVATGPTFSRTRPLRAALGWLAAVAVFAASVAAAQELDAAALAPSAVHTEREALARTVDRVGVVAAKVATRRAARPATTIAAPVTPPSAKPAPSAESLFEEANRARIRKDYDDAVIAYLRLQYRYPTSREARVSFVTMGRMQLDRADAAGALLSFERYERSGDVELADLAMAGRALALDGIGSDVAPGAWLALLAAHPDSPYAGHARLRARAAGSSL
jgi:hypothetical protein